MNQDAVSRNRHLVRSAAVLLAIYTLIEIADCVTLLLMHFGVMMRGLSAWGLSRERVWGFWTAIIVCIVTLLWIPFLMPAAGLTALEMPLDGLIFFLLLKGRFGDRTLQSEEEGCSTQR
jgi:hypothetical protein